MAQSYTKNLGIVLREIGSMLPVVPNTWGTVLNEELEIIDTAIADSCTPDQIANIRHKISIGNDRTLILPRYKG